MKTIRNHKVTGSRRGATLVLVVLLLTLFMIAIAFSVDLARAQLAQVELQSVADLAARAGAEGLARGVGGTADNAVIDAAIRDEIAMVAELNRVGGAEIEITNNSDISFGMAVDSGGVPQFQLTTSGGLYDSTSNAVRVNPQLGDFPLSFGVFVGRDSLSLSKRAAAIVQERDIVLVLDRSASMLDHDAGIATTSSYNSNLLSLEDDMYGPGDNYFDGAAAGDLRHSEFEITGSQITLSKIQGLKQAVLRFRNEIDASRGHESLGLVSFAKDADKPIDATTVSVPINITAGLNAGIRDSIVGNGVTDEDADKYASVLEPSTSDYRNFDYNYLAMRWGEGTNISDGIKVGAEVLFGAGHRPFAKPVMVLMADGRHRSGSINPRTALATALASHPDMTLFTISFGANADTNLMRQLATAGNGTWYHASDSAALNAAFEEIARTAGVTLIE